MSGATTHWRAIAARLGGLLALAGRPSDRLADGVKPAAEFPGPDRRETLSPEAEDRERQLDGRELELRMLMAHWM